MNQVIRTYLPSEWMTAHWKLWEEFKNVWNWTFTAIATPTVLFVEKYVFSDWQFLGYLMILIVLDFTTGIIAAMLKGVEVNSFKARSTVVKVIQYAVFLMVMHILSSFTIKDEVVSFYHYITTGAYIFLIGIEGASVLENVQKMDDRFDIKGYIAKIKEVFKK